MGESLVKFGNFELSSAKSSNYVDNMEDESRARTFVGVQLPRIAVVGTGGFVGPDETTAKEFKAVVVKHHSGRQYWREESRIPVCTSPGGGYGDFYGACARCQYREAGCKEQTIAYIAVPEGEAFPAGLYRMFLSITSKIALMDAMKALGKQGIKYDHALLRFRTEQAESKGGKRYRKLAILTGGELTDTDYSLLPESVLTVTEQLNAELTAIIDSQRRELEVKFGGVIEVPGTTTVMPAKAVPAKTVPARTVPVATAEFDEFGNPIVAEIPDEEVPF